MKSFIFGKVPNIIRLKKNSIIKIVRFFDIDTMITTVTENNYKYI